MGSVRYKANRNRLAKPEGDSLTPLEAEVVQLFVELTRLLGQPKSIGEIYGLLFLSPKPLSMNELKRRLSLSSGSASQGLRYLRSLGAARTVYVPGERKDFYVAVAELKQLATGFVKEHITPQLDQGVERLDRIQEMTGNLGAEEAGRLGSRLTMLRSWLNHGRELLPLIVKVMK